MKKLMTISCLLLSVLIGVVFVRTFAAVSRQPQANAAAAVAIDGDLAVSRLARSLTFRTVSSQPEETASGESVPDATEEFLRLHDFLRTSFPRVHETLRVETVSDLSLLFTWPGSRPKALPILLMGHLDVVPVSPGTLDDWEQDPFGGVVADGFVWGRGSMDDKVSVMAILEAVEYLLSVGFSPERTLFLGFGHDEEIGGSEGAVKIAQTLEQRGVTELAMVVDEGGAIVEDMLPGLSGPVALVGIAEKGSVTLKLEVEGPGGHSSAPPPQTQIGILAAAIARLEATPFEMEISGAVRKMFDFLGPEMGFVNRMVFANPWLFDSLARRAIAASPEGAAMLHTTTAVTIIHGGVKSNVLPTSASAHVNFRILPGETPDTVEARVREVVADERIVVSRQGWGNAPSSVSDPSSTAFETLARTIREVEGSEVLVAPYLVMAATDSRHFTGLSANVFRFLPARFEPGGLSRVHGTNERLPVESYLSSVLFFKTLIENIQSLP